MPLSSSSRMSVKYKLETVFGVPVAATACNALRVTGENLDFNNKTETSKEIRSDRQTTDLVLTGAEASGGINFETSYAEFDPLIEASAQGTWTVFGVNGVGAVIATSATFAANTLTAGVATAGASIWTNLVMGQWVKINGSSNPLQNIWAQISTTVPPTTTILTFQGTPFTGATGVGGAAVTVSASRLTNGVVQRSYTVETGFTDVSQTFTFTGMTVDKMSLKLASGSILTGMFDFKGKTMTRQVGSLLSGTVTGSTSNTVMNGVNNVVNVLEGGAALSNTFIKNLTIELGNNLRGQDGIGFLGNVGIASGSIDLTGSIEIYFADGVIYDKFLNNTNTSLSFRVNDSAGNGYVITMPNVKYSSGKVTAGAINQDVMVSMNYTALRDPVSGFTVIIDRAGAAVLPILA
jgi:hypothetical protein